MREVGMIERDFLALSMFKIDCQLILPHLDNSPLSSKLSGNMLMANDVVISCYASLPNLWSFALLGLILVVSLVLLVLMRKKHWTVFCKSFSNIFDFLSCSSFACLFRSKQNMFVFWAIEPQTLLLLFSVPKYCRDVVYCDTVRFIVEKSSACRK